MTSEFPPSKRTWTSPVLYKTDMKQATLGKGGTTCDGNVTLTQSGGGNDGGGGPTPCD